MFFCNCRISVATLLLIIHTTMYILIFLIWHNPWHKTIMTLFSYTTIKSLGMFNVGLIVSLLSCAVIVEEWYRFCWIVYLIFIFPITPLLVWYLAIGICTGIIWKSERHVKPLKPPFSLGKPVWYYFCRAFFAEFSLHLGKIMGTEQAKQCLNNNR